MDGGCGGQNYKSSSTLLTLSRTPFKQTNHLLTLFMSCWEKDGGLDVVHIVLKLAGILDPVIMMSVGAFCSNDAVILLPNEVLSILIFHPNVLP